MEKNDPPLSTYHETYVRYRADGSPHIYEYERKTTRRRIVKFPEASVREFLKLVASGASTKEAASQLKLAHATAVSRSLAFCVQRLDPQVYADV